MILFLFIFSFDPFPDGVDIDDQIRQCTDDSEHLRAIDKGVVVGIGFMVASLTRVDKMTPRDVSYSSAGAR